MHRRTISLVPLAPIPIPHQCPRNKALRVTVTGLLVPLPSCLEHHDLLDTCRLPLGKTTHSSLALKLPVKHQVWSQEAWRDKKPTLLRLPCFPLVCTHVCVYRHAMHASIHSVPRGRNRTWRWSWSRPFEAMQVKKPMSSELTRLITRAPSDCCLCLGNKTRKPLSLCLGQDGAPATRAEAEPCAQLCSNTEQRFSSSSVQPVMQPLVLKSQH